MKRIFYLLSLLILPAILFAQTYQQVKIHATPESLRTIAAMGIPVDDGIYRKGILETILSTRDVTKIRNAGFSIDMVHEDYSKFIRERNKDADQEIKEINRRIRTKSMTVTQYPVPVHFELGSMGGYYNPNEVLNELDSMRIFYPNLISVKTAVGSVPTVEGRDLYYVRISNTPDQSTSKPKIQYNSLIHAREPMGMQQMFFFMWYLLENYNTDAQVKYLVDHLELYFIPLMNPDGYNYNYFTDPGGGGMWRKNRKPDGAGNVGVDLNRNFGFEWGFDNNGSSPNSWDETYRGTSAFSENESSDFRDFCINKRFKFIYNYHTWGNETLYPWCYITEMAPDSVLEIEFTDRMMAQNGYISGPPGQILYNTNGDAIDWEYGDTITKPRIIAFTTETGNGFDGFWPPINRILPLAEENMYANLEAAKLTLPYAEITDIGLVINPKRDGYFHFQFKRLGLTDSTDYTVSIHPIDSLLFAGIGPPKTFSSPQLNTMYTDSISYSLLQGIQIGQRYRFVYEINNGLTIFRDTVSKYYGWPMVMISDSCNNKDNWTSTLWNTSPKTFHSAPTSMTDSPIGPYQDNSINTITLKNKITIETSPVAVIEYWVRYGIEKCFDYCQFSTSLNNGTSYTKQSTRYTNNGTTPYQDWPNPIYDGNRDWSQDRVVLENTAGTDLKVRFMLVSDGGMTADGLYFDDFKVTLVDMTYNGIDPSGQVLGFISNPLPNPASGGVSVNYQLPGNSSGFNSFQLINLQGITLKEIPLTSSAGIIKFSVTDQPAGVYLYRISGSFGTTVVKKLVVVH